MTPPRRLLPALLAVAVLATAAPAVSLGPVPDDSAPTERAADRGLVARVADRAGISQASARRALADPTSRVAPDGTLHVVDEILPDHEDVAISPRAALAALPSEAELFALHSLPGADQTIYLDLDGADLRGTMWDGWRGVYLPQRPAEGWTLDGAPGFSTTERQHAYEAWRGTAELFAAFDVDVTTQRPPDEALLRSGPDDDVYGSWVVVSSDVGLNDGVCGSSCSGIAFVGLYDDPDASQLRTPTLVFRADAGTIAHEVGHQLGLSHDGRTFPGGASTEYYLGHGAWSPVMGGGRTPLVQWSRGDYPDATNHEDDYAVMADHGLRWRSDEAGATLGGAAPVPTTPARITRDDVDVYRLEPCAGERVVVSRVEGTSPLDASLTLLDASGAVVTRDAAPVTTSFGNGIVPVAGQSAVVTDTSGRAAYARVEPGADPAPPGYPTYGSIGSYLLQTACSPGTPAAVEGLVLTPGPNSVLATWSEPAELVTGYRLTFRGQSRDVEPGTRSAQLGPYPPGMSVTVSVAALVAGRSGPAVSTTATTFADAVFSVAQPQVDAAAGTATITWSDPTHDPGLRPVRWVVYGSADGGGADVPVVARQHVIRDLPTDGSLEVMVCLWSDFDGYVSTCRDVAVSIPLLAPGPDSISITSQDDGSVHLEWPPASPPPGSGTTVGYAVSLDGEPPRRQTTRSLDLTDVSEGLHEVAVHTVTTNGTGPAQRQYFYQSRRASPVRDLTAVVGEDPSTLRVSWRPPSDAASSGVDRYLVSTQVAETGQYYDVPLPGDATSHVLEGLGPGQRVTVSVQSGNRTGYSGPANVTVTMPGGEPPLAPAPAAGPPTVAPGEAGGPATLVVRWGALAPDHAPVGTWRLRLVGIDDRGAVKGRKTLAYPVGAVRAELRLSAKLRWTVAVRAVADDGRAGPWSKPSRRARPR